MQNSGETAHPLTISGKAGTNSYTFRGKLLGSTLKPGRGHQQAVAAADGKTSKAASIRFTIAR